MPYLALYAIQYKSLQSVKNAKYLFFVPELFLVSLFSGDLNLEITIEG